MVVFLLVLRDSWTPKRSSLPQYSCPLSLGPCVASNHSVLAQCRWKTGNHLCWGQHLPWTIQDLYARVRICIKFLTISGLATSIPLWRVVPPCCLLELCLQISWKRCGPGLSDASVVKNMVGLIMARQHGEAVEWRRLQASCSSFKSGWLLLHLSALKLFRNLDHNIHCEKVVILTYITLFKFCDLRPSSLLACF